MTEVYEVATFYHHFDVVKEDETPPPALTIRICETLSCQMAGSEALRAAVDGACGPGVRVIGAPCIGRCEHAPAAVVGRYPVDRATPDAVLRAVLEHRAEPDIPAYVDYAPIAPMPAIARSSPVCAANVRSKRFWQRWRILGCADWAAPDFPSAASGASCAPRRRRG